MKRLLRVFLTLSFCFGGAAAFGEELPMPKSSAEPINRIVAVVNTNIITRNELDRAIQATIAQFQRRGIPLPNKELMQKKALDMLIDQTLQLSIAEQNHITTSEAQVDKAIEGIAKRNHTSLSEMKQQLKKEHITFDDFKEETRRQMTVMAVERQALASKINITPEEVNDFQKKLEKENQTTSYHLIDYLMTDSDKAKATALMHALKNNKQSPDLSGVDVNQMGWRNLDEIPDAFASHVVNLADNDVAGPILTGNGYHVIKLLGTRSETTPITTNQAKELLYQKKFQKALSKWLQELRASAYIKIYLKD